MSLDASELEGMSEDELRRKYDTHAKSNAGVPGSKEDFSDMVAKEMARNKQKRRKGRRTNSSFSFSLFHCCTDVLRCLLPIVECEP